MVFSGSDWCKPCIHLKANILSNNLFTAYSSSHLILQEVDFPYKKKNKLTKAHQDHNNLLADKYNRDGAFPKVLLINTNKEVIGEINYDQHMITDEFIFLIKSKIENQL